MEKLESPKPTVKEALQEKWAAMPYEERMAWLDRQSERRHQRHLSEMQFNHARDTARLIRLERKIGAKASKILNNSYEGKPLSHGLEDKDE